MKKTIYSGIAAAGSIAFFLASLTSSATPQSLTQGGPESVSQSRNQLVLGTRGMVVSDDPFASEWGAEILRKGGNAIDAAVATAFALSVTRPHYASIGGGGFLVYCPAPQKGKPSRCSTLDFREKAPARATKDMFQGKITADSHPSRDGALASGVPGIPAGLLTALEKWGTFSRKTLLAKPIEFAKKGIRVSTHTENAALARWKIMNDAAKKIFGCKSPQIATSPCSSGALLKQPDLARVLEIISNSGAKGFYGGGVSRRIVDGIQKAGGILTLEDFKNYRPKLREPVRGQYKGFEVISMPPPSSGGALVVQLLAYAERAEKSGAFKEGFGSTSMIHALTYAMASSFADRALLFGDPDFIQVPLDRLLSPSYLDENWKKFKSDQATLPETSGIEPQEPQFTTHFSVMDRNGNAVAITVTVNDNFGSGFVPPGTGIVMNNEMDDFSVQPGVPNLFGLVEGDANSISSGKRPLSSMSPTVIRDQDGKNKIVIGSAGGPRILTSVFLSLFYRLNFDMSLIDAVSAPRFHQQWKPAEIFIERDGFSPEVRASLIQKGYSLKEVPSLGKVHSLELLPNGQTSGAPDPRGEGWAAAE